MKELTAIFQHQSALMDRFHEIEMVNLPELRFSSYDTPLNLDDMRAQLRLKEYAWRITEELYESKCALTIEHAREEVIDAFHFLVEMFIMLGLEPAFFDEDPEPDTMPGIAFNAFMGKMAFAMNRLRYRPWKQKPVVTEKELFLIDVKSMWFRFVDLFIELGMTSRDVYEAYLGKNTVNQNRIITGV